MSATNCESRAVDGETDCVCEDLPCPRCGYNLRMLARAGVCPECALPVRAALVGHEFRVADRRGLRRLRYALAFWTVAAIYAPVAFLPWGLLHASAPLWLRTAADVDKWRAWTRITAFPFRSTNFVGPLLFTLALAALCAVGVRLRRGNSVLKLVVFGALGASIWQSCWLILYRPSWALPPAIELVNSLLAFPVAASMWVFLLASVNRRRAGWLWRAVLVGLGMAAIGPIQDLIAVITHRPELVGPPAVIYLFRNPSNLESWAVRWYVGYVAPVILPVQLLVIWILIRRLQAVERSIQAATANRPVDTEANPSRSGRAMPNAGPSD